MKLSYDAMMSDLTNSSISVKRYGAILTMLLDASPLNDILASLVLLIEEEKLGTTGSILLLSDDGKRLLTGAAPNLPDSYNQAIHGIAIGDGVGSCGTAAYTGLRVIVEDVSTHPYWDSFKELSLAVGLQACWSEPIKDSQGKVLGTFAMYYDSIKSPTDVDLALISEAARLASLAIERSRALHFQRLTANIFKHLPIAMVVTDVYGTILSANPTFYRYLQCLPNDYAMFDPKIFFQPSGQQLTLMFRYLTVNQTWQGELIGSRVGGEYFHVELTVTIFKEPGSDEQYSSWLFRDISERKKASELINFQANYDSLTRLANRNHLFKVMQAEIESDNLTPGFAFMLMDLDNFKQVNDTFGHNKGDLLLQEVSARIQGCVLSNSLLARLGGDEFALLLPGLVKENELASIANNINETVSQPIQLNANKKVLTSVSIGVARFPEDAMTLEQVLNCADQAMYISKAEGRNCFHFFTEQMQQSAERTANLHAALKLALDFNMFELYFQPIICLETDKIVRAEVLLRWQYEGLSVSPEEFIPLAESSGLIVELGHWVRQESMSFLLQLQTIAPEIGLSINVSMYEFWSHSLQDNLVNSIQDIAVNLTSEPFPFEMMTIEITESLLMKQHSHLIASLQKLRNMGIKIAVDDFGTGYSSLSYLSNFPIDQIKIDKSFIQYSDHSIKQQALVEAITTLGHALELCVIAEGVESKEELEFVKKSGIEAVQGYYFYPPMTKVSLLHLLR
ncbi:EAL domain-containing protein [Shewanella sp. D64]|uniref:bifunctional diguanylate cyclase/phosphodiesterase n=1 Tax=unclassified Shewanella TaxID=196818 RepID=UPI0022BA1715|nr:MULTISPECIES: EAL domain-containing protein [unclassified Shewanella]MEC4724190.1 EAL domain-containing protein [Shewanella sp. D64]MEC4736210.1 EAL domain-containing protein [Shewanella sp. E94]WBJ97856.1 EAL domain-containing protein [Shewanella sp. MTB7]